MNDEIVVLAPASLLATWNPVTVTAPSITEPRVTVKVLNDVLKPVLVNVPVTVKIRVGNRLLCTIVPKTTSASNPLLLFRMFTVLEAPVIVTVLVPAVKTEPAPDVFQFPETVHMPVVSVITPLAPPVIVTSSRDTVEAFAVRIPPFPMVRSPPVSARLAVASSVVDTASLTVRVPPYLRPRVAIVKVLATPEAEAKATLLNSSSERFVPAKVIVLLALESNVIVTVPASQMAPSVELLVHDPLTVQLSEPKSIAEAAEVMLTFPPTVTLPETDVRSPPVIVKLLPTDSVKVPLTTRPPA